MCSMGEACCIGRLSTSELALLPAMASQGSPGGTSAGTPSMGDTLSQFSKVLLQGTKEFVSQVRNDIGEEMAGVAQGGAGGSRSVRQARAPSSSMAGVSSAAALVPGVKYNRLDAEVRTPPPPPPYPEPQPAG